MQTALHITALVADLKALIGGQIIATEFYKKERAAYFFIQKDRIKQALGFLYHPAGSGCFLVPASKVKVTTREKPWPIFALDSAELRDVRQCLLDRIFEVVVSHNSETKTVVFEALGPNGNILLLDEKSHYQATLRKKTLKHDETYAAPVMSVDRLNPFDIEALQLSQALADSKLALPLFLQKRIIGFNRIMAEEAVRRAGIDLSSADSLSRDQETTLTGVIGEIAGRFAESSTGYLYPTRGTVEVFPFKLTTIDSQPEKFKTLSLAVQAMTSRRQAKVEEVDEQKTVMSAVNRAINRLEKRLTNVEADINQASDYEHYRKLGELLQINHSLLKKGQVAIVVQDVYAEPPAELTIELDPAITPRENSDAYFRKYRKGREGLELMKRRREITLAELERLRVIEHDLDTAFDSARLRYQAEIAGLMPGTTGSKAATVRLPYREATLSTGLTIFVGREGADNDRTTFEFAKPYELWFHTQQCPGSHVVMKFPNKSFVPSKAEIEEAAAVAAYHSKARNDSLVPVIYTQKKYVRKPRNAKPGLVTVEREKSVMVEPRPIE